MDVEQNAGDSEHVILELEERTQAPRSRHLLAESDWNKNPYFGLKSFMAKKKSQEELEGVQHGGTKEYYQNLNSFIADLEDMASGKVDSEDDELGA